MGSRRAARGLVGRMQRRSALLLPLALAACGDDPPPVRTEYAPLRYDHLAPLRLNVAAVEVAEGPPSGALDGENPAPPGQALRRLAQDRIGAGGSTGRAVFTVDQAAIKREGNALSGIMAVHLDVLGPDGGRAAFAEARVTRQATLPRGADLPGALYGMTRAMLDDMNVELEFQARRALRGWLQEAGAAPAPAAVEREDLGAPGRAGWAVPPVQGRTGPGS